MYDIILSLVIKKDKRTISIFAMVVEKLRLSLPMLQCRSNMPFRHPLPLEAVCNGGLFFCQITPKHSLV